MPRYNDSFTESSSSFFVDGYAVLGFSSSVVQFLRGVPRNSGLAI